MLLVFHVIRSSMSLPSILVLMLSIHVLRCRLRLLCFSMCLQIYSWRISLRRHRPERGMISYSPNSVLWIHHEFEGEGVLDVYICILYFPHMLGGFLHICLVPVLYIVAFGPQRNITCLFLTYISPCHDAPRGWIG